MSVDMTVVPFKNVTVLVNSHEASRAFANAMQTAFEAYYAEMQKIESEPGPPRQTVVATPVMSTELLAALRKPDAFTIMSRPATDADLAEDCT